MYKQILQESVVKLWISWRLSWFFHSTFCIMLFRFPIGRSQALAFKCGVAFDFGVGILSVCTVFVFTAFLKRTSATYLKYILQPQVVPLRIVVIFLSTTFSFVLKCILRILSLHQRREKHFQYSQCNKIYLLIFFLDYWSTKVPWKMCGRYTKSCGTYPPFLFKQK